MIQEGLQGIKKEAIAAAKAEARNVAKEEVKRYMVQIKEELVKDIQRNVYDKERRLMNEWGALRLAALSETTEDMKKVA